jgi:hypothetical protein
MKHVNLIKVDHSIKIGDKCEFIEPNVTEDTLFVENGEIVGFYIKKMTGKIAALADLANAEFLSDRVPKTEMSRGPQGSKKDKLERAAKGINLVTQYSTILGGIPPKPHMKRPYPSVSSVHQVASARNFIKAMIMLCRESESLIKEIAPEIYLRQKRLISENVPQEYRFCDLFTSSISNFNIAAAYHRDTANLPGCVNVIIAKKKNSKGGHTTVPDYGATVNSSDNSMLVYPAWRNVHGVTPIEQISENGYRNSLVFYPLGSFKHYVQGAR